jgi:hypothetical protein
LPLTAKRAARSRRGCDIDLLIIIVILLLLFGGGGYYWTARPDYAGPAFGGSLLGFLILIVVVALVLRLLGVF